MFEHVEIRRVVGGAGRQLFSLGALVEHVVSKWGGLDAMVNPEEIASTATYLASDEAISAVGACLTLNGGTTAR